MTAPKAITGKNKILLGKCKKTGEFIYMIKPARQWNWFWSFGYLVESTCHYHLASYKDGRNINMYDALLEDYELNPIIENDLWVFCEMALSIYTLKNAAELFDRGGSNMAENPDYNLIQNIDFANKINHEILPKTMQNFWDKFSVDAK